MGLDEVDLGEAESKNDEEDEKPEKTAISEEVKFFRVGSFTVYLKIDEWGEIQESECDCESTSRVEDRMLVYLFSVEDPIELDSHEKDLNYCIHEYAAIAEFWSGIKEELEGMEVSEL